MCWLLCFTYFQGYILSFISYLLSRYQIVLYSGRNFRFCLRTPHNETRLRFDRSHGFAEECYYRFAVSPQPIARKSGLIFRRMLYDAPSCPIPPMLAPLPYITAKPGTEVRFRCRFEETPVPKADIRWYFSPDKRTCSERKLLSGHEVGVSIRDEGHVLLIESAHAQHEGCYFVTAHNGVDEGVQEERGFLDVRPAGSDERTVLWSWHVLTPFLCTVVVCGVVVVIVVFMGRGKWRCREVDGPTPPLIRTPPPVHV